MKVLLDMPVSSLLLDVLHVYGHRGVPRIKSAKVVQQIAN